ncbi:MAG: hypothetical protein KDH96_07120 [Candidatus Riesia sp.]|nr:hypothetical protein [Candidatus Riesia sp.]
MTPEEEFRAQIVLLLHGDITPDECLGEIMLIAENYGAVFEFEEDKEEEQA